MNRVKHFMRMRLWYRRMYHAKAITSLAMGLAPCLFADVVAEKHSKYV